MPKGEAVEFNAIIQAAREKRKKEALANAILGSGRFSSSRKPPNGGGLIATSKLKSINNGRIRKTPLPAARPTGLAPSRRPDSMSRQAPISGNTSRNSPKLHAKYDREGSFPRSTSSMGDLHVRGKSAPYVVIASNFASGTTAADVETVLTSSEFVVSGLLRCTLISQSPVVTFEILFADYHNANKVVEMLHNKSADGRLLRVYMKDGGGGMTSIKSQQNERSHNTGNDNDAMEIDEESSSHHHHYHHRNHYPNQNHGHLRSNPSSRNIRNNDLIGGGTNFSRSINNQSSYHSRGRGSKFSGLVSDGMIKSPRNGRWT